jgi:hypothetical protein
MTPPVTVMEQNTAGSVRIASNTGPRRYGSKSTSLCVSLSNVTNARNAWSGFTERAEMRGPSFLGWLIHGMASPLGIEIELKCTVAGCENQSPPLAGS